MKAIAKTAVTARLRNSISPVGARATGLLPAVETIARNRQPVVDKPLIQYAVEEARAAGIEEFVFVTGRGKSAIEDHFDHSYELAETLRQRGKTAELEALMESLPEPGQVAYTRQQEPLGL